MCVRPRRNTEGAIFGSCFMFVASSGVNVDTMGSFHDNQALQWTFPTNLVITERKLRRCSGSQCPPGILQARKAGHSPAIQAR